MMQLFHEVTIFAKMIHLRIWEDPKYDYVFHLDIKRVKFLYDEYLKKNLNRFC